MKLNKDVQNAMLFVLYLSRVKKSTIDEASEELDISKTFLYQIARKLTAFGIVSSKQGPGGGYTLANDATVGSVLNAFKSSAFLSTSDALNYALGKEDRRALKQLTDDMKSSLNVVLDRSVLSVANTSIVNESAILDKKHGLNN